jgi:16S rRNA (guanine527-N7)-methyltransferase
VFHVKHPPMGSASPDVVAGSAEDQARLFAFAGLLRTRAVSLGFIGPRDADRILERHVVDSARAARCIPTGATVVDIGSGAGLPGVPVAILRPDLVVTLLEPSRKRVAFLELVVGELSIRNVEVRASRAQDAVMAVDIALARAVGDVRTSWRLAEPLLTRGGSLVYFAGVSWETDIERSLPRSTTASILSEPMVAGGGPLVMIRRAASSDAAG